MVRTSSKKTSDSIVLIVSRLHQGALLEEIVQALNPSLPRRTLQRYLAMLIKEGRLEALGRARSRRYYVPTREEVVPVVSSQDIVLSEASLSIQAEVTQSIQARRPIGYNQKFLKKYRPNETFYLSEATRKYLHKIGKSPDGKRPAGTYARAIMSRLLIDLSWNSSRLEGNTYSLLETERLLELGEVPEGKDGMEAQMILNHKAAIEFMIESADQLRFNSFTILNLHALLSDNLLRDQRACGALRTIPVAIGKSVYKPLGVPQLIKDYFEQILDTAKAILDPFEQSFFVMVHLPYLQPFLDVNKRVSRLAANIPLIRENLCPLSFVDVPQEIYISGLLGVYELNRIELLRDVFIWAYERSCSLYSVTRQQLGEPDPFRLQYRNLIITTIGEIVRGCMDKQTAVAAIKQKAHAFVGADEAEKFLEVIETELMSLHKGNIARFRLKVTEFNAWLKSWR